MLKSLVCIILFLYIVFISIELVAFTIRRRKCNPHNKSITVSDGIHYLSSIIAIIITFALWLNTIDYDNSILWFYVIFGTASVVSVPVILWVVFWKIEYNDKELLYRNILGICRKYDINSIYLKSKNQYTTIMYEHKKLTDYNFMLLNIIDVKDFETFVKSKND